MLDTILKYGMYIYIGISVVIGLKVVWFFFIKTYRIFHKLRGRDFSVMDRLHDSGGAMGFDQGFFGLLFAIPVAVVVAGVIWFATMHGGKIIFGESFTAKSMPETSTVNTKNIEIKGSTTEEIIPTVKEETIPNKEEFPIQKESPVYSKEQIEQMEEKAQYNGNDPAIRERLGLPPKRTE